jgi:hypothetical protein
MCAYSLTTMSVADYTGSNDFTIIINWKGRGKKRQRPNLKYHSDISLEGLRKPQNNSVTIVSVPPETRTAYLRNTSHMRVRLNQLARS